MATAVTPSNCYLCDDQCNSPTKLPNCGHIFCKACLMTYACIYKEDNDTVFNLKCPSCGVNNDKPRGVDTESWLDTLSAETVIAEDKPSSSPEVECASCKSLGRSEKAVKYCLNCMECLCQLCLNICHTLKPMRHHEFIDISNACDKGNDDLNLLRKMSSLTACASHPETIKFHCLDDDSFCCTICIVADHGKCSKVVEIEKEVVGEAYRRDMAHTKHSASNVLQFAHEAIEKLQSGIKVQNKQADDIAEHMTVIRYKIIKVLDELESKCNTTAKDLTKRETTKIQDEIRRLKSEVESFESHVTLMEKTDKTGSASHQYIAKKNCQEKLRQFEDFMEETTRKFESIKVGFKHEKLLDELLNLGINDTTKLGSVRESPDNPIITLHVYAEAKLKCYIISKVGEEEVKENYTSKTTPTYSSEVFLSNNQLVLLDSYIDTGHCLLVSEAGKVLSSCDFLSCGASSKNKPYCITDTKLEGVIAVSMPKQKQIRFVSTKNGQLKVSDKSIQTKYKPGAICGLKNGDIAVAWNDPVAFGLIDINKLIDKVYFCQDKAGRSLKSFDYIAVDEDRSHVIQPCTTDRAVYCFDFNGNPIFEYTHLELNNPQGVAVDKDGNIYVCTNDYPKSCIHVISPTGAASRMIKDGCPPKPLAIAFNKDGDMFAVTCTLSYRLITFFSVKSR